MDLSDAIRHALDGNALLLPVPDFREVPNLLARTNSLMAVNSLGTYMRQLDRALQMIS